MNKDSRQIYRLYVENTEDVGEIPRFKVGDYVKVVNPIIGDQLYLIGQIGKIKQIRPRETGFSSWTYMVEFLKPNINKDIHTNIDVWKGRELELFDINVNDEDKPEAADLLSI
jgi:hypothetical protein